MKSFKNYLIESAKTYNFKITIAGDLAKETTDKIKSAADRYDVIKLSKATRLPVQRSNDFPTLGPVEINLMDLEVQYPVTPEQLHLLISEIVPEANVRVRTLAQSADAVSPDEKLSDEYTPILDSELPVDDYKAFRTDMQLDALMKEFSEMAAEYEGPKADKAKTTNDLPNQTKSAMGSSTPTMPKIESNAR